MFLGRSGTGKSTHSRLWLESIEGTELLNDDNPVIRVTDGQAFIYGTPWSGKTPCYKNEVLPLKAVVRLSQAPHNKIERLSPLQSYASLMPACSCMRWDRPSVDALHKRYTDSGFEQTVSIYRARRCHGCPLRAKCHRPSGREIERLASATRNSSKKPRKVAMISSISPNSCCAPCISPQMRR